MDAAKVIEERDALVKQVAERDQKLAEKDKKLAELAYALQHHALARTHVHPLPLRAARRHRHCSPAAVAYPTQPQPLALCDAVPWAGRCEHVLPPLTGYSPSLTASVGSDDRLRLLAEMENVRRRAREDVDKANKFGIQGADRTPSGAACLNTAAQALPRPC